METLQFFNVTLGRAVQASNFGSIAKSSSDDILFRIVNASDLYQADDVTVEVGGNQADQLYLSLDGDNFYPQVTVGDITPGGMSTAITMRRVTPATSPASCSASLTATPASWSDPVDTSTSDDVPLETE